VTTRVFAEIADELCIYFNVQIFNFKFSMKYDMKNKNIVILGEKINKKSASFG